MKLDDLTIFLKAVDKTKGVFGKVNGRLEKLGKVAKIASKGVAAVGAAAVAGFSAAVLRGQEFVTELNSMSLALGVGAREADALFQVISQSNPAAQIDQVKEGVLTLTEAFFDARSESGPLFDLMKNFGAEIDFNVEGPREQLAEFLRVMKQIPDETVRVGGAISVLAGDDAKAFLPLIRNVELLDERIGQLSGSIDDIPNVYSESDIKVLDDAKLATQGLAKQWENFGKLAYRIVAPAITAINNAFTNLLKVTTDGIRNLAEMVGILDDRDRIVQVQDEINITNELLDTYQAKVANADAGNPGIFGLRNPAILEAGRRKVVNLTNDLSDLRLELTALQRPESIFGDRGIDPSIESAEIAKEQIKANIDTSKIVNIRVKREQKIRDQVLAALAETGPDPFRRIDDLNGQSNLNTFGPAKGAFGSIPDEADIAIDKFKEFQTVLGHAGSAISDFSDIAGSESGKSFRTFQKLQIAISSAAAISAALQAASDPTVPGLAKIGIYLSTLATLTRGVRQLKSLSIGSSSVPTGGSSTAPTSPTSSAQSSSTSSQNSSQNNQENQKLEVTFSGAGAFGEEIIKEFVDRLNRTGYGRDIVVR